MSFLKIITLALGNELDRTLVSLFNAGPNSLLDEKSYQEFHAMLLNQNQRYTKPDALNGLVRSSRKQTEWQGALRHLMVMHKLIHDLGEESFGLIPFEQMKHMSRLSAPKSLTKIFVHNSIAARYYNYLQKLSLNYEDLSICFYFQEQFSNKLSANSISPLHFLSKLQNTLRSLIQVFPLFEVSLGDFIPSVIIQEIAYFCLTDCYYYYTYINQVISPLLDHFFDFSHEETILLYEIYSEHVLMTRKLESFFVIANKLKQFPLKSIKLYQLDLAQNSKIELYVKQLRTPNTNGTQSKRRNSLNGLQETTRIVGDAFLASNAALSERHAVFEPISTKRNGKRDSVNQKSQAKPQIKINIELAEKEPGSHRVQVSQLSQLNPDMLDPSYCHKNSCGSETVDMKSTCQFVGSQGSFLKDDNTANNSPMSRRQTEPEMP